jgi:hypothetical protein
VLVAAAALTAVRAAGPELAPVLAIVVIGTVVSRVCESVWYPGTAAA